MSKIIYVTILITLIATIILFKMINRFEKSAQLEFTTINEYNNFKATANLKVTIEFKLQTKNLTLQTNNFVNSSLVHRIVTLNLSTNDIHVIQNGSFNQLTKLKKLDLSNNNIRLLTIKTFDGLGSSLETLNLSQNNISELPPRLFSNISNLKKLNLDYNQIQVLNTLSLNGLEYLNYLSLNYNRLSMIEYSNQTFQNLHELHLDYNNLSQYLHENRFVNFPGLLILNIGHNYLSNTNYNEFKGLKNLTTLFMDGNLYLKLNGTYLKSEMPNLKTIGVNDNFWHCEHLEKVLKNFQKNHINYTRWVLDNNTDNVDGVKCIDISSILPFLNLHLKIFEDYEDFETESDVEILQETEMALILKNEALLKRMKKMQFFIMILIILIVGLILINIWNRINFQKFWTHKHFINQDTVSLITY